MNRKNTIVVAIFSLVILGAVLYLCLASPNGSADGQSYETDKIGLTCFILIPLVGLIFIHFFRPRKK